MKIKILIMALVILTSSNSSEWVKQVKGNCFSAHLKEAISVNRLRKHSYSRLTNKRTRSLSNSLITLDRLGLLFSKKFDARSQKILGPNGVPLLCEVIPSMIPVLNNSIKLKEAVPLSEFIPFSASKANRTIKLAYENGGLQLAFSRAQSFEAELALNPRFNCLARQFIRSIRRLLEVAILSESEGAEELAWDVIKATLLQLRLLVRLDHRAAVLQADGIPILCAETPELPSF